MLKTALWATKSVKLSAKGGTHFLKRFLSTFSILQHSWRLDGCCRERINLLEPLWFCSYLTISWGVIEEISVRKKKVVDSLFVCSTRGHDWWGDEQGPKTKLSSWLLVTLVLMSPSFWLETQDFIRGWLMYVLYNDASGLGEARRINFLRRIISSSRGNLMQ